ncbi:EF-hand domain-containing protein [Lentilitoribacter sp. Alg239-R112]|uniref:EF-hand domain-containing protein n=1 Tax=Lentilitoribacter sp. Alg239-R112 TaxID=2305987 RepID=UPI0013A6C8B8|nr:EF-hand domain-containing protein [Lentilitoribacter sp. Alg239-R112]
MYIKTIVVASALALMITGVAAAKDGNQKRGKRGFQQMIEKIDVDKSGSISLEEFANLGVGKMISADKDGNGILAADEIQAEMEAERQRRRQERLTRRLDIDGDGTVTVAELKEMQAKRFAVLDVNSDGSLSEDELKKIRKKKRGYRR